MNIKSNDKEEPVKSMEDYLDKVKIKKGKDLKNEPLQNSQK